MLQLISKYKSVLVFILIFLGSYFVLSLAYGFYLKRAESQVFYPDFITHQVAVQSAAAIDAVGYTTEIAPYPGEASAKLIVNGQFLVRVVEGCNGMSVIVLFCAFVLSFFNGWGKTLLFIVVGSLLIYVVNVLRVAALAMAIYEYPGQTSLLHEIAFPAVIYGLVFLLWIFWVSRFKKGVNA